MTEPMLRYVLSVRGKGSLAAMLQSGIPILDVPFRVSANRPKSQTVGSASYGN